MELPQCSQHILYKIDIETLQHYTDFILYNFVYSYGNDTSSDIWEARQSLLHSLHKQNHLNYTAVLGPNNKQVHIKQKTPQ